MAEAANPALPATAPVPAPAADMLARARALFASPAVVRARPLLLGLAALLAILLLFVALRSPDWRPLYPGLSDADTAAVAEALAAANFDHRINPDTGTIEVAAGDVARARILLAGQGLPQAARSGDSLGEMPLGASRSVEAARLKAALAAELAASVEAIDGVKAARVHVATPEPSVFVRDRAAPSASVFVTLAPGRTLSEAQVRAILWLVATSVPGLSADKVSVVDQSGALLSAGASGDAAQLAYQTRLETHVRERLAKLLTPLIGAGRFTAEVAADIDFSENEASSERFQPAGTLKTEQASRTQEASPGPARGIPGALSNTAPAGAQITATPPQTPPPAAAPPTQIAEQTSRMWEIGKDVQVTRGAAPRLRRLSVAVVIDRAALGKAGTRDLPALTRLVQGAVGYDGQRGDLVEVQARGFAPPAAEVAPAWYKREEVQTFGPWAIAGLLVLIGGGAALWQWRKRSKAAAAAAAAAVPPIDGGELAAGGTALPVDYREKLDAARGLVSGDADRAMAVARAMLADQRKTEPEGAS